MLQAMTLRENRFMNNTEIVPFAGDSDICDIADPHEIGSLLIELLMKVIGTWTVVFMAVIT